MYAYFKRQTNEITQEMTWKWGRMENLNRKTKSCLIATQNNAIRINYFKANIDNTLKNSKYKLYDERNKTIKISITECRKTGVLLYTTRIHMQKQNTGKKKKKQAERLCCFKRERFNFWLLWHDERDTILKMLTPSPRAVHFVVFKISVSRDPKILTAAAAAATVENSTLCPNGRNSIVYLHGPMLTFNWLFCRTISSGHDIIHTPVHFLSGLYYYNGDNGAFCARA